MYHKLVPLQETGSCPLKILKTVTGWCGKRNIYVFFRIAVMVHAFLFLKHGHLTQERLGKNCLLVLLVQMRFDNFCWDFLCYFFVLFMSAFDSVNWNSDFELWLEWISSWIDLWFIVTSLFTHIPWFHSNWIQSLYRSHELINFFSCVAGWLICSVRDETKFDV